MKKLQIIKIPSREVILSKTESKAASQFSINIYELAKEDENTKSNKTIEIFEETIEKEKQRNEIKSKEKKTKDESKKETKKVKRNRHKMEIHLNMIYFKIKTFFSKNIKEKLINIGIIIL